MTPIARENFESSFWLPVDDNPPVSQPAPRAREHLEDSLRFPFSDTLPISHPGSMALRACERFETCFL